MNLDIKTGGEFWDAELIEFSPVGDKPRGYDHIKILWYGRPAPPVGQDSQYKCGSVCKGRMYGIVWRTYTFSVATKHKQTPSRLRKFLCLKPGISLSQTFYTKTQEKIVTYPLLQKQERERERDDVLWRKWWITGSGNYQKWSDVVLFTQQLKLYSSFMIIFYLTAWMGVKLMIISAVWLAHHGCCRLLHQLQNETLCLFSNLILCITQTVN